jgi:hypothetical protein
VGLFTSVVAFSLPSLSQGTDPNSTNAEDSFKLSDSLGSLQLLPNSHSVSPQPAAYVHFLFCTSGYFRVSEKRWMKLYILFLGSFAKFRTTTMSFIMSLCPSAGKDPHEIVYLNIFEKHIQKIQVPFKSDKNNGYLT